MKRSLVAGVTASLLVAGCSGEAASEPTRITDVISFSNAVHNVADNGGEEVLPDGVDCDFEKLIGRLSVQRMLGDDVAIVEDITGNVPEYGLVDCVEGTTVIVRGNDGY